MSEYYNPNRKRNLYNTLSSDPFRLSRSKIDLYLECPRCFYLDRKLGVARPPGFPFALNSAVDALLKKEFDIHRAKGSKHPLMQAYKIDAIPLAHEEINKWRDSLRGGIEFLHPKTNLMITGGVDDVWINPKKEFIVVDYKATAKESGVNIDADWQKSYKRQVEIYQWLLRKRGYKVSDTAYFVYANGRLDKKAFDAKLEFDIKIIPYSGNDFWVENTLIDIKKCLDSEDIPEHDLACDYCSYHKSLMQKENDLN